VLLEDEKLVPPVGVQVDPGEWSAVEAVLERSERVGAIVAVIVDRYQ
jgi:hypothetical protein